MPSPVARSAPDRRRRTLAVTSILVVYALGAWLIALPLGPAPRYRLPTCACADVAQEVWWLAVAAHAPFALHTAAIDVPRGVSLLDNASFPLLGALFAPVTRAIGPVASLVILLRLSFFASATAAYAVLRSARGRDLGAAIGGAFYAFSPYMTHQGASHFFLVFAPVPPLLLALVLRVAVGPTHPRWPVGVVLGLLVTAQFFVDSEVLVITAVVAALTLAVLAVGTALRRGPLVAPARRLAALAWPAVAVAAPLLALPVWQTLTGADRIVGSTQPTAEGVGLLATFLSGDRAVVAGLWAPGRIAVGQYLGHSSYLGPLLVVACLVVVARRWRVDRLVRAAAVVATVAWVLQLGAHLTLTVRPTGVPLPFDLLTHLPVLEDIIPSRFGQLVGLGVGALVAVGVDGIVAEVSRLVRDPRPGGRLAWGRPLAAGVVLLAGLVLAAPDRGYGAHRVPAAPELSAVPVNQGQGRSAAGVVPRGAVVLAFPVPAFPDDQAMLWQAIDDLRFRLVGGYAIRPGPGRRTDRQPLLPPPQSVPRELIGAYAGAAVAQPGAPGWVAAERSLSMFLQRNRVRAVVVQQGLAGSAAVDSLIRAGIGSPTTSGDGMEVWVVRPTR